MLTMLLGTVKGSIVNEFTVLFAERLLRGTGKFWLDDGYGCATAE